MVKIIVVIVAALAVLTVAVLIIFHFTNQKPDFSAYQDLESPRISQMPNQKMLQFEVRGKAEEVLPQAFGLLYQTYFSLPETPKGGPPPAARLRCAIPNNLTQNTSPPAEELSAVIGLPLPEAVTTLASSNRTKTISPTLAVWEYGVVAEILHHGPYDREPPTIQTLLRFIEDQGYAVTGIHEEEYLFGPGAPGATPDTYRTIIRYPVKKQ